MNTTHETIQFDYNDIGKTKIFIEGGRIAFAKIAYSLYEPNPLEDWDGEGRIYSFNDRHQNFIGYDKEEEIDRLIREEEAVILDYSEHGSCQWSVQGGQHMPAFDSVSGAGVWVPDEETLAQAFPKDDPRRKDFMLRRAAEACRVFTDWCNGEVYRYSTAVYRQIHDEDGELIKSENHYESVGTFISEDDCGGFYGFDHVVEEAIASAKYGLRDAGKTVS